MATKNILRVISDKEMDRKDFLKYSGAILVGAIGLGGIVTIISQMQRSPQVIIKSEESTRGFGSGKYGA